MFLEKSTNEVLSRNEEKEKGKNCIAPIGTYLHIHPYIRLYRYIETSKDTSPHIQKQIHTCS